MSVRTPGETSMLLENLLCWRCQGSLDAVPQPFARAAECPHCNADLHVCKLCRFFDASARRGCKEPVADEVTDKDRSNFCGYFEPTAANVGGPAAQDAAARSELESLFGLTPGEERPAAEGSGEESYALNRRVEIRYLN